MVTNQQKKRARGWVLPAPLHGSSYPGWRQQPGCLHAQVPVMDTLHMHSGAAVFPPPFPPSLEQHGLLRHAPSRAGVRTPRYLGPRFTQQDH